MSRITTLGIAWGLLLAQTVLLNTNIAQAEDFHYQPYGAWRGRAVSRDGLFHVDRIRWGNGVTDNGVLVLNHAFDVFGPVVGSLVTGKGTDTSNSAVSTQKGGSGPIQFNAPDEYVREQRRANDLLERTEKLLLEVSGRTRPSPSTTNSINVENYLKGQNPWNDAEKAKKLNDLKIE